MVLTKNIDKMKKRIAFFVLASFICSSISAQRYFEVNDIRYRVIADADEASTYGTVSVAKPEVGEYEDDIKIPTVVKETDDQYADAYKVISIDEKAFSNMDNLKSVELPPTIEIIGKDAFECSVGLNHVIIPVGNLTEISSGAFYRTGLVDIQIPSSIKVIGNSAFASCYDLTTVTFNGDITTIGNSAFAKCKGIKQLKLPNTVRLIGEHAFYECENLEEIILGTGIQSLGDYVFEKCEKLKSIELPEGLKNIGKFAFSGTSITEIIIPESIREIKAGTFSSSKLKKIKLPQRLRSIDGDAFFGLDLEKIEIPATTKIDKDAFRRATINGEPYNNKE